MHSTNRLHLMRGMRPSARLTDDRHLNVVRQKSSFLSTFLTPIVLNPPCCCNRMYATVICLSFREICAKFMNKKCFCATSVAVFFFYFCFLMFKCDCLTCFPSTVNAYSFYAYERTYGNGENVSNAAGERANRNVQGPAKTAIYATQFLLCLLFSLFKARFFFVSVNIYFPGPVLWIHLNRMRNIYMFTV